jgi:hypothetical protein
MVGPQVLLLLLHVAADVEHVVHCATLLTPVAATSTTPARSHRSMLNYTPEP